MDLSFATNDPLVAEAFTVQRSQGSWGAGAWNDKFTSLGYYGIISIATAREIEALPEADRVHEAITINCEQPLYVTRIAGEGTSGPGTSDLIVWNGDQYRVVRVENYQSRGMWYAIALRMIGS